MRRMICAFLAAAALSAAVPVTYATEIDPTVPETTALAVALAETVPEAGQDTQPDLEPEQSEPAPLPTTAPDSVPVQETEPAPEPEQPPEPEEAPAAAEPALEPLSYFPTYFQNDYPHIRYSSGTIATSGCSVTSLAMVATYLTGHIYTPDTLASYFADYNSINNMDKLEYMSETMQLPWYKAENFHVALNALKEGKIVIALMNGNSLFTDGQHFIVWTGINENGKIMVNDPNRDNYSLWNLEKAFSEGFREGDLCLGYSGAWVYDPAAMPEEPFVYQRELPQVPCRYPGLTLTPAEENLLARMIWVEAQGEPFEGQQAIAEVVLNRLVSGDFQDTIENVIYAENQFRSVRFLADAEPNSVQYTAIERALKGPYVLPMDVVFFATYPVNDQVWGQIGGHTFCRQFPDPQDTAPEGSADPADQDPTFNEDPDYIHDPSKYLPPA